LLRVFFRPIASCQSAVASRLISLAYWRVDDRHPALPVAEDPHRPA
jgi:hypothetical protein